MISAKSTFSPDPGKNSNDIPVPICVTPTKNEAWIIKHFAPATKLWVNRSIVADQGSTDGTREFLSGQSHIELILNESAGYDEAHRQNLLLSAARSIPGKRILIGLDADEALSANCLESREWELICDAPPGTILRFPWVNVLPGFKDAWIPPAPLTCGFVDDGSPHHPKRIHSPRVPQPLNAPVLELKEIVVLHFQYVLWDRMLSKQRWYQAWEHVKHQQKGALEIFRQYNHMAAGWAREEIHPVKPEWLKGFERAGIDFTTLKAEPVTWWDREVAELLRVHGPQCFRKIAIWDFDWKEFAKRTGVDADLSDPRSPWERLSHRFLGKSQGNRASWMTRGFEAVLRRTGW